MHAVAEREIPIHGSPSPAELRAARRLTPRRWVRRALWLVPAIIVWYLLAVRAYASLALTLVVWAFICLYVLRARKWQRKLGTGPFAPVEGVLTSTGMTVKRGPVEMRIEWGGFDRLFCTPSVLVLRSAENKYAYSVLSRGLFATENDWRVACELLTARFPRPVTRACSRCHAEFAWADLRPTWWGAVLSRLEPAVLRPYGKQYCTLCRRSFRTIWLFLAFLFVLIPLAYLIHLLGLDGVPPG